MLITRSFAKINITLEVLKQFPDGYHQIISVMQAIELCDTLFFKHNSSKRINLTCNTPLIEHNENLVFKAACLLKEYSKYPFGVDIHLKKMIPISSGLGGGSSNAAVTLLTLCKLWDLQISSDNLAILAQQIGSDVGFFLNSPSCLAEQKGDTITPIKTMNPTNMVLIVPKIDLNEKTSSMYQSLTNKDYTDGKLSMKMAKLIEDGEPPDNYLMFNVFENNAEARFPEISKGKKAMIDAGASWVQLSGSGPSLYTFTKSSTESKLISKNLQIIGYNPIISKTLNTY